MPRSLSLTSAQINALTTGNETILYNAQSRDVLLYGGANLEGKITILEIDNISGDCLTLRNNSSLTNFVNFDLSNTGTFNINVNGGNKIFNIVNHDGLTNGLSLGNTLVTSTADQLNAINVIPGTASASKALVLDENKDIMGIHNIETDNLTVNGTLVTASATELNYTDIITAGTVQSSKAVIVNIDKDITGFRNLSADETITANTLVGTLSTTAQPAITSFGSLTELTTAEFTLGSTTITATGTEINTLAGVTPGTSSIGKVLVLNSSGNISGINSISTNSLIVNGVNITSSGGSGGGTDYTTGVTPGIASPSLSLVLDANKDITGIRNLTSSKLNFPTQNLTISSISAWNQFTLIHTNDISITTNIIWNSYLKLFIMFNENTTAATTGKIRTSEDGITWIEITTNIALAFLNSGLGNMLRWCNDLNAFITKQGAVIYYSNDIINWYKLGISTGGSGSHSGLYYIKESNIIIDGRYTFISSATVVIYYSTNSGISWSSAITLPTNSGYLADILYGHNLNSPMYIIVSYQQATGNSSIYYSTNFTTWTSTTVTNKTLRCGCYSPYLKLFITAGTSIILSSSDGINWTTRSTYTTGYINDVKWLNDLKIFIALGPSDILKSSDGINWTQITISTLFAPSSASEIAWAPEINKLLFLLHTTASPRCNIYSKSEDLSNILTGNNITYTSKLNNYHRWNGIIDTEGNEKEYMRISSTGEVGINITDSTYQLEVNSLSGSLLKLRKNNNYMFLNIDSSNYLNLVTSNIPIIYKAGFYDTYTANSGTNNTMINIHKFSSPIISSVNSSTISNSSTLYIEGAPTANTGMTLTNKYALYINSGNNYLSGIVNISEHNGSNLGLQLNGTLVTATAAELNYNDTSVGAAQANKALIVDSNKKISGISSLCLGTSTDTGRILSILNSSQISNTTGYLLTYGQDASINNQAEFGFNFISTGSTSNALLFGFYGNTNILKVSADKCVDIPQHNGNSIGLRLGGILITATGSEINTLAGVSAGTASINKALILNASGNISGINSLTCTNFTATGSLSTTIPTGWKLASNGTASFAGGASSVSLKTNNDIWCAGTVYSSSDIRLKTDIQTIDDIDVLKILNIRSVLYKWKNSTIDYNKELGFIAQELLDLNISDIVKVVPNSDFEEGFSYVVSYDRVCVYLVRLAQIQHKQLDDQNNKIKQLEEKNNILEDRLKIIEDIVLNLSYSI